MNVVFLGQFLRSYWRCPLPTRVCVPTHLPARLHPVLSTDLLGAAWAKHPASAVKGPSLLVSAGMKHVNSFLCNSLPNCGRPMEAVVQLFLEALCCYETEQETRFLGKRILIRWKLQGNSYETYVGALLQGFSSIFVILITKINSQDLPQDADRIPL